MANNQPTSKNAAEVQNQFVESSCAVPPPQMSKGKRKLYKEAVEARRAFDTLKQADLFDLRSNVSPLADSISLSELSAPNIAERRQNSVKLLVKYLPKLSAFLAKEVDVSQSGELANNCASHPFFNRNEIEVVKDALPRLEAIVNRHKSEQLAKLQLTNSGANRVPLYFEKVLEQFNSPH